MLASLVYFAVSGGGRPTDGGLCGAAVVMAIAAAVPWGVVAISVLILVLICLQDNCIRSPPPPYPPA